MNFFSSNKLGVGLVLIVILVLSTLVAARDLSVGTDAIIYVRQFEWVAATGWLTSHEPGFSLVTFSIANLTSDYRYFLATVYLITNFGFLITISLLADDELSPSLLFSLFGMMFFSSWYQVATLNGLRQGASLPFLYSSFIAFNRGRYRSSAIMAVVSASLHLSSILTFPFFFLCKINNWSIFLIFILSAAMYALGISEFLVEYLSNLLSLSFYEDIISYGEDGALWSGFQLDFFIYSVFWGALYFAVCLILLKAYRIDLFLAIRTYIVMIMPYFYFAHGAFSNRYALIGWLFLPYLHSTAIANLPALRNFSLPLSLLIFTSGLIYYVFIILGLIS